MNTAALFNFLHHLLFLFVILKFFMAIFLVLQSKNCRWNFDKAPLMPLNVGIDTYTSTNIALDLFFPLFNSIALVIGAVSVTGFFGAIYLRGYYLINFAVGVAFLFASVIEFTCSLCMQYLLESIKKTVADLTTTVFDSVNDIDVPAILMKDIEYFERERGWAPNMPPNSSHARELIDFLQLTLSCCGLDGRFYWDIPMPQSCCSQRYYDHNCTVMTATPKGCLTDYSVFKNCMVGLYLQNIFYGLLSFATGLLSLYLSHLQVKYPDGNFGTDGDDSSTSAEDENFFDENSSY